MSSTELLACIGREDRIQSQSAALDARARQLDVEADAITAEAAKIADVQRASKAQGQAALADVARRAEGLNKRGEAAALALQALNEDAARLDAEVENFNAACAARPFDPRDKESALAEHRARSAAASGSGAARPAPTPGSGPFEEGVAAYDRGQFELAFALWLPLAEQGRAAAQFNLAALLENGKGVARSDAEAARWYLKAAEQGDLDAQFKAGWLYEQGRGVPRDLAKASYWYGKVLADGRQAAPDTVRLARERLASLSRVEAPADVFAYTGGRFVIRSAESGECVVALQGDVNRLASAAFDKVLAETASRRCNRPATLLLESPGGILADGLWLGAQVRRGGLRTVARYECASSCALIFLGGVERVLWGARAAIGFHQAAWSRDLMRQCEPPDSTESLKMRDYLRVVMPANADQVFQLAMNTSCDSIAWIHGQRAIDLGVATRIEAQGVDVFGSKAAREQKQ